MLDFDAVLLAIFVDAGEPGGNAGEEFDVRPAFIQVGAVHLDALFLGDLDHGVEIGKDLLLRHLDLYS